MILTDQRILLTGGHGFLGSEVRRLLLEQGVPQDRVVCPRSREVDLTHEDQVEQLFRRVRPTLVLHLAAEVGGIGANRANPGRYFYANLAMGLHLVEASRRHGVAKFVQVGTICAYPKHTPVPFREEDLWAGYPEETNAPYGIAKKALLTMLQAYREQYGLGGIYLLPVNLYGPGDNFDPATSHVIPALVDKFVTAADEGHDQVQVWGSGQASREFLYVEDCARGLLAAAEAYDDPEPVNLGTGQELTIAELAGRLADLCGFQGELVWDRSRPDGQPRRCLDTTRAAEAFGFRASTSLEEGLARTVAWWRERRRARQAEAKRRSA